MRYFYIKYQNLILLKQGLLAGQGMILLHSMYSRNYTPRTKHYSYLIHRHWGIFTFKCQNLILLKQVLFIALQGMILLPSTVASTILQKNIVSIQFIAIEIFLNLNIKISFSLNKFCYNLLYSTVARTLLEEGTVSIQFIAIEVFQH